MQLRFLLFSLAAGLLTAPAALAQEDAGAASDGGVTATAPPGAAADAGAPEASAGDADGGLSADDEALLKEIAEATGPATPAATSPSAPAAAPAGGGRGTNPFSNLYNPALSLNGLLLAWGRSPAGDAFQEAGVTIQEAELQVLAYVDPYFSANFIFSVPGLEGLGIEEGYVSLLPQPLGLSIRAGKMRIPFGRENGVHTHALPFVDRSLANVDIFGEEGLSEVGVEASWLAPLPWYAQLTLTGMNGDNEALFHSPFGRDLAGFAALKNVFDLTDDATLELDVSYTAGNDAQRLVAQALGLDLVIKWRPASDSRNSSAMLLIEALGASKPGGQTRSVDPEATPTESAGLRGEAQYQLTRGWYLGGRFDVLRQRYATDALATSDVAVTTRESLILVYAPTEFSAFRLQGNVEQSPAFRQPVIEGFLQANFTVGTHPAHSY